MRPYHKKWKTARDLFVFQRKSLQYISYHLRIPEGVLENWQDRFSWNELRASIDMRPQGIANTYLTEAENVLNQAAFFGRNLSMDELKKLNYLNKGIETCRRDISLPKQAQVLEYFLNRLDVKERQMREIKTAILNYLTGEINAIRNRTTVSGMLDKLQKELAVR
jgi:hypothetical protein